MGKAWIQVGVVEDNRDDENRNRIRVRLDRVEEGFGSGWARSNSPFGGRGRGAVALPEADDEVLVCYAGGHRESPIVLGAVHGKDKMPYVNDDGDNNIRRFVSRSGHRLDWDDTDGAEQIRLADQTGKQTLTIDCASNTLTLCAESDVEAVALERLIISAPEIVLEADTITVGGGSAVTLQGGTSTDIEAGARITAGSAKLDVGS